MSKLVSLSIGADPSGAASAAQVAAGAAADKVLAQAQTADTTVVATPTEQIADRVPQALETQAPTGSPEQLARVEQAALAGEILTQEEGGAPGVFAEANPEQAQQAYLGQLAASQTRTPEQTFDFDQGIVTLPVQARANDNLVAKISEDVSKSESAFTGAQAAAPKTSPEILPAYAALQRLGLAQEASGRGVAKGSVQPKQGVGAAAYLAFMSALASIENEKADGKLVGKDQPQAGTSEDYTNRFAFTDRIADSFEKLVAQPQNIDPTTGEASSLGFRSQLSKEERASLGLLISQTMAEAGLMQRGDVDEDTPAYVQERQSGSAAGKELEYALTTQGWKQLQSMAPMLKQLIPTLARPVSQTPLPNGGLVGELALGQKQITRTPLPGQASQTMLSAMDVMGTMPNMISQHKAQMTQMMINDIAQKKEQIIQQAKQQVNFDQRKAQLPPPQERNEDQKAAFGQLIKEYLDAHDALAPQLESPFAKLFGQDNATLLEIAEQSEIGARKTRKVYWDGSKWMRKKPDGTSTELDKFNSQRMSEQFPDPDTDVVVEAELHYKQRTIDQGGQFHRPFAEEVVNSEWQKAQQTLQDALEQAQKGVFYHGVTAIGNSSRLMVTSTTLNYQANKLARFMTDNPRPSMFTKGGEKDAKFHYLVARALLDGADTLTADALVKKFKSPEVQRGIAQIARDVYAATTNGDAEALGRAISQAQASDLIADEWEGNGEWGFPVDALHEYGKYLQAPDGTQLGTRLKVEVDGINNGSSIQGLQFGDEGILRRAGVIYDHAGDSVIPEGNMRGYIFNVITQPDDEAIYAGLADIPAKHLDALGGQKAAAELLDQVKNKGLVKKLVKIPLMTTIYGKPYDMHGDHARSFVAGNWRALGLKESQLKAANAVFDKVISNGLRLGLNSALMHQDVIKYTAGWMFNMMDEIPQIEGPNGYIVQAGGLRYVGDTGNADKTRLTLSVLDEEGRKTKKKREPTLGVTQVHPTATAAKAGGKIGSITRNQLAVNGTHNIDATIAQLTLIRAKKALGKNFWGQQVFDAFIGDLDSIDTLLDIGNKTFHQVNNTYNMLEAEQKAYQQSFSRFLKKAKEAQNRGETWDIGEEGTYRGVYEFLKSKLRTDGDWVDPAAAAAFYSQYGISYDGKNFEMSKTEFTPQQVVDMVRFAEKNFVGPMGKNVNDSFKDAIATTNANRKKFREWLVKNRKYIRQYN